MPITKTKIIQALGGIIVGNSVFSFFALPLWLLAVSQLAPSAFSNPQLFTNPNNFLLSLASAMSQITAWTVPIGAILWLIWLVLCFSKFNETENPKTNLFGIILHYILGMAFFLIPLLYLPYRHYKKLFVKATGQDSKLLLIWQILNILSYFLFIPIVLIISGMLIFPFILALIAPTFLGFVNSLGILVIFIFLLNLIQTILGCYFIWQISTKL